MSPKASIILSVYNGEKYICEAINSILSQSYSNFELIIINDGSIDETESIINSFSDPRIKKIKNSKNIGLIASLNLGFSKAIGEYIFRMDADDICHQDRLKKQINYFDKHKDVGVLGTWVKVIGDNNFIGKYYTKHEDIKASTLFLSSLAHPTVAIRHKIIVNNGFKYDENFKHAEDYELWTRMINTVKFANLPKPLLYYRKHSENISKTESPTQFINSQKVRLTQIQKLEIEPNEKEIKIHAALQPNKNQNIIDFLEETEHWFAKILQANQKKQIYNQNSLEKIITDRLLLIANINCRYGLIICKKIFQSKILIKKNHSIIQLAKLFIKCIIKK